MLLRDFFPCVFCVHADYLFVLWLFAVNGFWTLWDIYDCIFTTSERPIILDGWVI
jgi:hypothetical protein